MKLLGPRVEPLGLHITRAALVDAENRRSPTGTHLAVYVEPDATYTAAEYLAGTIDRQPRLPPLRLRPVAGAPLVRRVPGAARVGRRPVGAAARNTGVRPPPRRRAVDWEHADLAELLAESDRAAREAGDSTPVAFTLFVAKHLQRAPEYEEAVARASADAASTSTTGRYR